MIFITLLSKRFNQTGGFSCELCTPFQPKTVQEKNLKLKIEIPNEPSESVNHVPRLRSSNLKVHRTGVKSKTYSKVKKYSPFLI